VLALWVPSAAIPVNRIEDVALPQVRVIAVANPSSHPTGQPLWKRCAPRDSGSCECQDRVSDNISMAKQYGASGNADVVFTAYSLVMKESGKVIRIDEKPAPPDYAGAGVIAASPHKPRRAGSAIRAPRRWPHDSHQSTATNPRGKDFDDIPNRSYLRIVRRAGLRSDRGHHGQGRIAAPLTLTADDLAKMPRDTATIRIRAGTKSSMKECAEEILARAGTPQGKDLRGRHQYLRHREGA